MVQGLRANCFQHPALTLLHAIRGACITVLLRVYVLCYFIFSSLHSLAFTAAALRGPTAGPYQRLETGRRRVLTYKFVVW
jgi:hypothetical protein